MRLAALTFALAVVAISAAPADACRIAEGNAPPAPIFLDAPPASLEPGEVVLKVRFERMGMRAGEGPDTIVVDCTSRNVFAVIEQPPLTPPVPEILVFGPYDFDRTRTGFVVGKLLPPSEIGEDGNKLWPTETKAFRFKPRLAPN